MSDFLEVPNPPVVLLFPGQGAQFRAMAVELYGADPLFTVLMDEFFDAMGPEGAEVRADWLADEPGRPLDDASRAQPLLFAIGHALGRAACGYGVRPAGVLGHSVGELAGAVFAGVFTLSEAGRVMAGRSAAMRTTAPGGMLAVAAAADRIRSLLADAGRVGEVAIAALNAPAQTVLSGPEPALSAVALALADAGLAHRRVPALQAFHSPTVAGAAVEFESGFADVALRPPTVPIWSTRTAARVSRREAVSAEFWAGQLARPVLFWPALDALLTGGDAVLVEVGPGRSLSVLARRHPRVRAGASRVLPLLPKGALPAGETLRGAVERLLEQVAVSAAD